MFAPRYFAQTYFAPRYFPPSFDVEGELLGGGDPDGAWENFGYYRRKYLAKRVARPELTTVFPETDLQPFDELARDILADVAELEGLGVQIERELAYGLEDGRLIDILAAQLEEIRDGIEAGKQLQRQLVDELAVISSMMIVFFGEF